MTSGILSVLLACLCWGLSFVVPSLIEGFNPIEIALGRFAVYGFICIGWLCLGKRYLLNKLYMPEWRKAITFGLASTLVCYIGLVFCMKYASAAIAALMMAMSPMTIAFAGNFVKKEFPSSKLFIPAIFMLVGVTLANLEAFGHTGKSLLSYLMGLTGGLVGLLAWTWYSIANSQFLNAQNKVTVNDWGLMMGAATGMATLAIALVFSCFSSDLAKFTLLTPQLITFLVGSIVLGIFSTWIAFFFWNYGSKKLPISLAGQLMISEVIFGLTFIYCVENRLPILGEVLGILLMLVGVIWGCRTLMKVKFLKVTT